MRNKRTKVTGGTLLVLGFLLSALPVAGAVQIFDQTKVADPDNPNVVYAVGIDARQSFLRHISLGSFSVEKAEDVEKGIYISRDGGQSWKLHESNLLIRLLAEEEEYETTLKGKTKAKRELLKLYVPLPQKLAIEKKNGKKYLLGTGPRSVWIGENMNKWTKYEIVHSIPDPANPPNAYVSLVGAKKAPFFAKACSYFSCLFSCMMAMSGQSVESVGGPDRFNSVFTALGKLEEGKWVANLKKLSEGNKEKYEKVMYRRVTSFLIDPGSQSLIYGVSNDAVHRTTDAGKKWKKVFSGPVFACDIDRKTPNVLYAIKNWKIYVSHRAGEQMEETTPKAQKGENIRAFAVFPHDEGVSMVSLVLKGGGLLKGAKPERSEVYSSADLGKTWALATTLPVMKNAVSDQKNGVSYLATEKGIYVGKGNLQNWQRVEIGGEGQFYLAGKDPTTGCVYIGGDPGLYKSCDQGSSWTRVSSQPIPGEGKVTEIEFASEEGVPILTIKKPGFIRAQSWILKDTGEDAKWIKSTEWLPE